MTAQRYTSIHAEPSKPISGGAGTAKEIGVTVVLCDGDRCGVVDGAAPIGFEVFDLVWATTHLVTQTAGPVSAMLGSARAAVGENFGTYQPRLPVGCVSEHVAGGHHAMTPPEGGGRDSEALIRTLYNAHGRAVLAYISQMTGDRYEAQDVLQETMLRAWRHQQELVAGQGSVRGWLLTVAKHVALDRARARLRRPQEVAEVPSHAAVEPDRASQVVDSIVVYEAMQKLSEEQREVLILLRFQGRSVREAAEVLGVPEGTVKSRAYHALQALRKWLGENL
jgi:RNA polymerase sigma-70 factor (ECF subfamily)